MGPADAIVAVDAALGPDTAVDAALLQKRLFVTSQAYTGNLGGLAGADASCQAVADAAGVRGVYKAWLSNAMVSAESRLTHATVPYTLVDGTVVATNWAMLTSGTLLHAIDVTELGTQSLGGSSADCVFGGTGKLVWTNSNEYGEVATNNLIGSCGGDWSSAGPSGSSGPFGAVGIIGRTDRMWTLSCTSARCETTAPLYCIEQ